MIGFLGFLAGFRHLIRQGRQESEWLATLMLASGVVVITLELVGDGLQAGAALDTVLNADPTIVRGLMEASFPLYGAIGLIMSALLLASAGAATLITGVLPRWTGWFAYAAAIANLSAAPSILGGTDYTAFWSAPGYVTFVAQVAKVIWFLIASISMLRKPPRLRLPRMETRVINREISSRRRYLGATCRPSRKTSHTSVPTDQMKRPHARYRDQPGRPSP